jgi:hypothetical protein
MNVLYAILDVDKTRELVAGKVIKCGMCGQDIAAGFPMDVQAHAEIHIEQHTGHTPEYQQRKARRVAGARNLECAPYGEQAKWYGTLLEKLIAENQIDHKFLLEQGILVPVVGRG